MKKFMILAAACCLVLASCNNQPKEQPQPECQAQTECQKEKSPCCEKKQKAMEDWANWENLTEDRKVELLNERKACYDKQKAEQAEREAQKAKFEEQMSKWDNLTTEEKKAAFDLCPCCKKPCCKEGPKEGKCCKEGKGECKKDGKCPKEGECKGK